MSLLLSKKQGKAAGLQFSSHVASLLSARTDSFSPASWKSTTQSEVRLPWIPWAYTEVVSSRGITWLAQTSLRGLLGENVRFHWSGPEWLRPLPASEEIPFLWICCVSMTVCEKGRKRSGQKQKMWLSYKSHPSKLCDLHFISFQLLRGWEHPT